MGRVVESSPSSPVPSMEVEGGRRDVERGLAPMPPGTTAARPGEGALDPLPGL
jgi:hypothetical protein